MHFSRDSFRRSRLCTEAKGVPGSDGISDMRGLGPGWLQREELFYLLKTAIQAEALSHAMQFAQRLRDAADEEIVTPLGNFVAAAYREPDLAEELDRADEAAETEVDEETPSPAQQPQLLRAPVNLGHPPIG